MYFTGVICARAYSVLLCTVYTVREDCVQSPMYASAIYKYRVVVVTRSWLGGGWSVVLSRYHGTL